MKLSASVRYGILLAVLWSLLFVNLAGVPGNHPRVTIIEFERVHGWPCLWMYRWGHHLTFDTTTDFRNSDWPWSSWPCKGYNFSGHALLIDTLVGVVLMIGTHAALRLHARRTPATEYAAWPCFACGGIMVLLISIWSDMGRILAFGWIWLAIGLTFYAIVKHVKLRINRREVESPPPDNSSQAETAGNGNV